MIAKLRPYFPFVLVLFHSIGLYLFLTDPDKVSLTGMNMLLCAGLVILAEENKFLTLCIAAFIFVVGFLIEYLGVNTGWLFGSYHYTEVLGPAFLDIPIIIGMNWFVIVVSSASLFMNLKAHLLVKVTLSGLFATLMDAIIEPVAIQYKFWVWENDVVPFFNYFCWFIFSSLFAFVYLKFTVQKNNTAFYLFLIWIAFFGVLNLM